MAVHHMHNSNCQCLLRQLADDLTCCSLHRAINLSDEHSRASVAELCCQTCLQTYSSSSLRDAAWVLFNSATARWKMKSANSDLSTVPLAFVSIAAATNNKTPVEKQAPNAHQCKHCQAECQCVIRRYFAGPQPSLAGATAVLSRGELKTETQTG